MRDPFFIISSSRLTFAVSKSTYTMIRLQYLFVFVLCAFVIASCSSDKAAEATADNQLTRPTAQNQAKPAADNSMIGDISFADGAKPQPRQPQAMPTPPKPKEPAQNADGVWHYTCAKGCAGGAGSAVPCAVCGEKLKHNQAYHNSGNTNPTKRPGEVNSPIIQAPGQNGNMTITPDFKPKNEPAQNSKGVWHYICAKGCAGGAGAKGPCAMCGAELQHNREYHN